MALLGAGSEGHGRRPTQIGMAICRQCDGFNWTFYIELILIKPELGAGQTSHRVALQRFEFLSVNLYRHIEIIS